MMGFVIAAGLLTLLVWVFLIISWRRAERRSVEDNRRALNVAVYRDQLAELAAEREEGSLAEADYLQARQEIERRLLDDVEGGSELKDPGRGRQLALTVLVAIPLATLGIYLWHGHPEALTPQTAEAPQSAGSQPVGPQQIEAMVKKLAAKLDKNPDDAAGWAMLAKSYMTLERPQDAVKAFSHLSRQLAEDPQLMVDYAEALASTGDMNQRREALTWVGRALKIDPGNGKGLFMAGGFAYAQGQFEQARADWEKLMPLLEPGSQDAAFVLDNLNRARAQLHLPPASADQFAPAEGPTKRPAGGFSSTITGQADLDPALRDKINPGDTVFIFARAVEGPRMPLAILRTTAAQFPIHFELTDAMAMNPQFNLSSVAIVRVEVRVSKSGNAMPSSGDLTGASLPLKPGSRGVEVTINQVQP